MPTLNVKSVSVRGQSLLLKCVVSENGTTLGMRTAALSAVDIIRIRDDDTLTNPQKIAALRDLVVAQAQQWRLPETMEALDQVGEFLTGKSVDFERAPLPEIPPEEP